MRLVYVHGIRNEGSSSAVIQRAWTQWIEGAAGGPCGIEAAAVVAPFYGDVLHALQREVTRPEDAIAQGLGGEDTEAAEFMWSAFEEIAQAAGFSADTIQTELARSDVVPMGLTPHDRTLIAMVRRLERLSPLQGRLALRLLGQAHAYLTKSWVAAEVDAIVTPALTPGEPLVVVGHSLGSVVAYKLLRDFARRGVARDVRLFVTVGSPLAIRCVQGALGRPWHRPSGMACWLNGFALNDFVTLGSGLTDRTFAPGIENREVTIPGQDAHAVRRYLSDPAIAGAICEALGGL